LTLDAIEPKVEEDLKRKRQKSTDENTPSPQKSLFSDGDLEWLRRNRRPSSQASDEVGPLPNFTTSRKRARSGAYEFTTPPSNKRQHHQRGRIIQSSPGYNERKVVPTAFHSSPPRTPPQRRKYVHSSSPPKTPPPRRMREGADLLLYLATSPSPAVPRTAIRHIPSTPPLMMMSTTTPGAACPQTPQTTGFNFADFVNITPSPAQAAFGPAGRGTPIAKAQKRLNFDQLVPPSGSPPNRGPGYGVQLSSGSLVS
jgi:hypothetical protein